ncbi:hypothetical protein F3B42_14310 [Bacteroides ovatus]|jgi:hypothetical protein|nr:hypothetical protein F3B42_14310 [Bacteroides ovatus]KAA4680755.1 hypothetical protein F3B41_15600 [Bacteroides ovatus]DAP46208.1 MAG TPA: hypothetical protein [Caudoviricetes sp.]
MDDLEKTITYSHQVFAQQELFKQWLIKLYGVNEELKKEYNRFYFNIYYITLSELINPKEGLKYIEKIVSREYCEKLSMYFELKKHLDNILNLLTEEEVIWIHYKRDSSCHIFQDSYNYIKENFGEREKRKDIPLSEVRQKIEGFLIKHDMNDQKADIYIFNHLYPHISKMFQELKGLKG